MTVFYLRAEFLGLVVLVLTALGAQADIDTWEKDWPQTDFSRHSVDLAEIFSGASGGM